MYSPLRNTWFRRRARWALLVAGVGLAGCSNSGIERERPNVPPETRLVAGPPDGTNATSYRVALEWTGNDPDGVIDHFDMLVVNHPSPCDSAAGLGFAVTVPAPEDSRWQPTSRRDSVLVVSADSLCRDPRPGSGETPGDVLQEALRRWHTVFVRAVDDHGASDATPDYRTFNARTFAPTVALRQPAVTEEYIRVPRNCAFQWSGEDPVDESRTAVPAFSRWVVLRSRRMPGGTSWAGMPDSLYALSPWLWSPWRAWNAPDGTGVSATLRNLLPVDGTGRGYYLFAVQAKDEAGAITPVFDDRTPGKNNVAKILVDDYLGPILTVRERNLGTYTFVTGSRPVVMTAVRGQPVDFRWRADASAYGLDIAGYRYGVDVRDPGNDDQWSCGWSPDCTSFLRPVSFATGVHRIWIQARDTAGVVVEVQLELWVADLTRSRPLLLVDDSIHSEEDLEVQEDRRWQAVVDSLRRRHNFTFDPAVDIYDVRAMRREPPPLVRVFDYRAVVWCVRADRQAGTALASLARFFDPFVLRNRNAVLRANYIDNYVDNGGALWLSGQQPTDEAWDFGIGAPLRPYPVDVLHWDDYQTPHPQEDSAGVNSLLYELGAEIADQGCGGRSRLERERLEQNCTGFRRAHPADAAFGLPERLVPIVDRWAQPGDPRLNPLGGRPNVEIYNPADGALPADTPPRRIPEWRYRALYTYVNSSPRDPVRGWVYPLTADGEPAVILSRGGPNEPGYSRALCGFELFRLDEASHLALAEYILHHTFQIDRP